MLLIFNAVLWDARIQLGPAFLAPSPLGCSWAEVIVLNAEQVSTNALEQWSETRFEEPLMVRGYRVPICRRRLLHCSNRVAAYTGQNQGFATPRPISDALMGRGTLTLVNGKSSPNALRVYHMNLSNGDRPCCCIPLWCKAISLQVLMFDSVNPRMLKTGMYSNKLRLAHSGNRVLCGFPAWTSELFWVSRHGKIHSLSSFQHRYFQPFCWCWSFYCGSSQVKICALRYLISLCLTNEISSRWCWSSILSLTRSLSDSLTGKPGSHCCPLARKAEKTGCRKCKRRSVSTESVILSLVRLLGTGLVSTYLTSEANLHRYDCSQWS